MRYIKLQIKALFFAILMLFTGCSQSAFQYFDKQDELINNVQHTQVLKIVVDDQVKAIANITYLNSANPKKWNNNQQNFIIGEYSIDTNDTNYTLDMVITRKKKIQLDQHHLEYETIILQPKTIKPIHKTDPLYQQIPFKNSWADYKLITFDNIKEDHFTFIFKDDKNHIVKTLFKKETSFFKVF